MAKHRRAIEITVPNKIAKKMRRANRIGGRRRTPGLFGELAGYKPSAFFSLREKLVP